MIQIPDLSFQLDSDDYPVAPLDCQLSIRIQPTSSNQDVNSISYLCVVGEDTYTGKIDPDILEAISTHFDLDIEDELWNTDSLTDINLAIQLDRLIATLEPDEITSIASPYTTIWNVEYPKTDEEVRQAFVNVFLAECSLYLVIWDLLCTHNAWQIFPFSWELPLDDPNETVLTGSVINYMNHAISACSVISAGISRPIAWMIESFNNSFSVDYIEGEEIPLVSLSMQVTMAISKYNTTQAGIQRQQMEAYVNSQIAEINKEYIEKQQYILQTLTEIHQELAGLTDRVASLESISGSHSGRLDTLEREVTDLAVNVQGSSLMVDSIEIESNDSQDTRDVSKEEDKNIDSNPGPVLELVSDVEELTERIRVLESLILNR